MQASQTKVLPIDIEKEVKRSFLDYSMSVIVSRALPDVRDGLKPVHRRILYAFYEQGMTPEKPHRKSANLVGLVLGQYHPHGDAAVYDAMVRMAQDFSMRYCLVDGHGNFGSVDGDSPAAMRYTEARLTALAVEMLRDIEKDTVDFRPNYDDTRQEPVVLPARLPNLLINGSTGIAVGMATSIPPHNLTEVVEGLIHLLENPEATVDELMRYIKGPDFPTAGLIMGTRGMRQAYRTGRGSVTVRGRCEIEEKKGGRTSIVVTEIPYMVNKAKLVERIAELVKEKKIDGITDLRDESDRRGIRIVMDIRRDISPSVILNKLYRNTQLQDNFGITLLALVDGEPQVLNLKEMLNQYLNHRREVIRRRTEFDLKVARDRLHIVEGLKIALDNLDEVVDIIRNSPDVKTARNNLMSRFDLTEMQAEAIVEMRLRQLTGLERNKLEEEYRELVGRISDLEDILRRPERVQAIIKEDLIDIKTRFGDKRRTEIREEDASFEAEDLIEEESIVVTLSNRGYIKRQPLSTYRSQRRGGKGVTGTAIRSEDFATDIFVTTTLSTLLFFTNHGRVYSLKAYQVPEASRQSRGTPVINFLRLNPGEKVNTVISVNRFDAGQHLVMATRTGMVKKVPIDEFRQIRRSGIIAINLRNQDELVGVQKIYKGDRLVLVTGRGYSIVFDEGDVRVMGRGAAGVRGISLEQGDKVIDIDKYKEGADMLLVTERGYGKRTSLQELRLQKRGGKGLKTIQISEKTGELVGGKAVFPKEEFVALTGAGFVIRLKVDDVPRQKRYSRGVVVMRCEDNDHIVSIARFKSEDEEE
ncbi:DNA gyrase subunit A [Syntrophothermus lipocalidus]|uniref:DNA gyrase subunit A n=1 Tax=Syntrophothermus lipocalidus (strain DSM 12680 / TGB-C1) TaxID=643648 RepID=D7CPP2_SYNLT|nr:DNA gyrase subunit A [Syntrophothermus lipocalidus]ADI00814.1 DNA gyrase, A subunit [Syntrophothermus lipocalidus DSM 12680]